GPWPRPSPACPATRWPRRGSSTCSRTRSTSRSRWCFSGGERSRTARNVGCPSARHREKSHTLRLRAESMWRFASNRIDSSPAWLLERPSSRSRFFSLLHHPDRPRRTLMPAEAVVSPETTMTMLNSSTPEPASSTAGGADHSTASTSSNGSDDPPPAAEPGAEPEPGEVQPAFDVVTRSNRVGKVFVCSVAIVIAFMLWATIAPDALADLMTRAMTAVSTGFGWIYLVVPFAAIALLVWFAASRFGRLRLGPQDSRPEYRTITWLAMILAAVMGIGLVSYGVAEPMSHFMVPPHGLAEPGTMGAAVRAMQFSYLDWGLSGLGDLRSLRSGHRLLDTQEGAPGAGVDDAAPGARPVRRRWGRQPHRHPHHHRHALRHDNVARPRGFTDRAGAQHRPRCRVDSDPADPRHRDAHSAVHGIGADRGEQGHQVHLADHADNGDPAGAVRLHH